MMMIIMITSRKDTCHVTKYEQKKCREELVYREGLAGSLLLHVGFADPVKPVPAQSLQVAVLSVLQQHLIELALMFGVHWEGETVPRHGRPAAHLELEDCC